MHAATAAGATLYLVNDPCLEHLLGRGTCKEKLNCEIGIVESDKNRITVEIKEAHHGSYWFISCFILV